MHFSGKFCIPDITTSVVNNRSQSFASTHFTVNIYLNKRLNGPLLPHPPLYRHIIGPIGPICGSRSLLRDLLLFWLLIEASEDPKSSSISSKPEMKSPDPNYIDAWTRRGVSIPHKSMMHIALFPLFPQNS